MSATDSLSNALAGFALAAGAAAVVVDAKRRRSPASERAFAPQAFARAEPVPADRAQPLSVALTTTGGRVVWRVTSECDDELTVDIFSYRDRDDGAQPWRHELMERSIRLPPRHRHLWPATPPYRHNVVAIGWSDATGTTGATLTVVDHAG